MSNLITLRALFNHNVTCNIMCAHRFKTISRTTTVLHFQTFEMINMIHILFEISNN